MDYKLFLKGMATGVAVGAAAAVMMDPLSDKQRHKLQKRTGGMFRSIGGMVDNAIDMMK